MKGIRPGGVEEGEHLGVHDPAAGGEPLHVALAVAGGGPQGVLVIHHPADHVGDRFEAAVGMLGEPGHHAPVIHAPPVLVGEVGAEVATLERGDRAERLIAGRVVVDVVHREDERVDTRPREAQLDDFGDRFHAHSFLRRGGNRR